MSAKGRDGADSLVTGHMGHGRGLGGKPLAALSRAGVSWCRSGGLCWCQPSAQPGISPSLHPHPEPSWWEGAAGGISLISAGSSLPQPKPTWHSPAWPLKHREIFKALSLTRWLLSLQPCKEAQTQSRTIKQVKSNY